jgi:hypothetical protein
MLTSNTCSVESLTAIQCLAFSILLLLSALALTLTFTHIIIIVSASTFVAKIALLSTNVVIPTCSLLFLLQDTMRAYLRFAARKVVEIIYGVRFRADFLQGI